MNKKKLMKKPGKEMKNPKGWPKRQLEKQRKMQEMKKKKGKGSLMKSFINKKQRG